MADVSFEVRDPKHRLISAAPFRDRVVHHAVHAVIAPLFERGFIDHTYANRAGKGTHRAVARYERLRDRYRHVLRGDIYRPRVRVAAGRASSAAAGERAALPQPPARAPRPLAGGHRHTRGSGAASSRLGGARGACRHVAAAPRDLPGRVVRTARAAGPGGLTGPRPSCDSRRLLEQQCREPPAWRAQQEHRRQPEQQPGFSRFEYAPQPESPRSRPRRASTGASRAGHDEPAPLVESGGVTAGVRPGPRGRRAPAARFARRPS